MFQIWMLAHMGIFTLSKKIVKQGQVLSTLNYNVILNNVFENISDEFRNVIQIDKFYVSLGNDKNFEI